jgi:hypothetical protein
MGYNPYLWYTKTRKRTLPALAPLLLKIRNGDFERTPYFAEADMARKSAKDVYEATKKNSLISDPTQLEYEALASARLQRVKALKLMEVGHEDEIKRLIQLRKELVVEFGQDVWDEGTEKQRGKGTTEDLYWWYKKKVKFGMTPSEIDIKLKRDNTKGLEHLYE